MAKILKIQRGVFSVGLFWRLHTLADTAWTIFWEKSERGIDNKTELWVMWLRLEDFNDCALI